MKIPLTDKSILSSPPSCVCNKIKYAHEEKPKEKLPIDYSFNILIINDDLSMGDKSCGVFYKQPHSLLTELCFQ